MVTQLKIERIKKGIKQWKLASSVGISQAQISHYEVGMRRCPADVRHRIARVLEMPVDTLFPKEEVVGYDN